MTNTLLASVTDVTDGMGAVSSSDRSFYPEYGLAGFKATTQDYSASIQELNPFGTGSLYYSPVTYLATQPNTYGIAAGQPTSVFAQSSGAGYGNYGNIVSFNSF